MQKKRNAVIKGITLNSLFIAFGIEEIRGATTLLDIDCLWID